MSKVALLHTSPTGILADISLALSLIDFRSVLKPDQTVILKENISWHLPMPGANSTPWQLEGVIQALKSAGICNLVVVANKTVVTRPRQGAKLNRLDQVYRKYNIPVKYNFLNSDMRWIDYVPKSKLSILPKIFPHHIKIPDFFPGKPIIHLPTMKCHVYTKTTGAMKNAFGGLLNYKRHYTHSWIHETLVDLLKIQKEIHPGILAVMDGTTAGDGPGPRTLRPVEANFILAGVDQVAIDAVAAWLMGFEPMEIPYIRLATEAGLGTGILTEIEIVGDALAKPPFRFQVGNNLASRVGNFLWFGPLKRLQNLFFHTPLVYAFVIASDWYHDRIWWNLKGKPIFNRWLQESQWGKLFQTYR